MFSSALRPALPPCSSSASSRKPAAACRSTSPSGRLLRREPPRGDGRSEPVRARVCRCELGAWRAFIATLFGLPVPPTSLSSSANAPASRRRRPRPCARRGWWPVAAPARAGSSPSSRSTSPASSDWSSCLAPGERGYVLIIAAERQQTEAIMGFIRALLKGTPLACALDRVRGRRRDRADERHHLFGCDAQRTVPCARRPWSARSSTRSASGRTPRRAPKRRRGLAALLPAMATIPDALLLGAGPLWPPRRLVAHARAPFRQARSGAGLARADAGHEPAFACLRNRARLCCGSGAGGRGIRRAIPRQRLQFDRRRRSCRLHRAGRGRARACAGAGLFRVSSMPPTGGRTAIAWCSPSPPRGAHCRSRSRPRAEAALSAGAGCRRLLPHLAELRLALGSGRSSRARSVRGGVPAPWHRLRRLGSEQGKPLRRSHRRISSRSIDLLDLPRLREQILALESQATAGGRANCNAAGARRECAARRCCERRGWCAGSGWCAAPDDGFRGFGGRGGGHPSGAARARSRARQSHAVAAAAGPSIISGEAKSRHVVFDTSPLWPSRNPRRAARSGARQRRDPRRAPGRRRHYQRRREGLAHRPRRSRRAPARRRRSS